MGIEADHPKFVKIGMDKCNLSLINQYLPVKSELLIARALSYLGNKKDQFFLIQKGFDKIKAIDDDPQDPLIAQALFDILLSYGRYFGELDYYYQAIERIQELMSYHQTNRHNWNLLAKAYYEVSFLDNNPQSCELALYFMSKALNYFECPRLILQKGMILSRLGELKQQSELFHVALENFEAGLSQIKLLYQPTSKELFEYAKVLDLVGNFHEDEQYYVRALETLSHLLLTDPGYKDIHHQIALTQFHFGELSGNTEIIKKSLSHFKLALVNPDNDAIYTDWAIACMTLSEMAESQHEAIFFQAEASSKLKKALKNGALQAYYFMACLCSINQMNEQALKLLKLAEKHECLPSAEDLMQDEWLSNIRSESEFIKLVERQEMKRL
jgi:tetratricopeptide (TPR) repeat protein